jgi:hypothetical protein
MNKVNYIYLLRIFNELRMRLESSKFLVIMDECHEMYADMRKFIRNGGLEYRRGAVSNRGALHTLMMHAMNTQLLLMGVTATPYSAMAGDPLAYPRQIVKMPLSPVFPGAIYSGYGETGQLQNIDVIEDDRSYLEIIRAILARPRQVLADRRHVIPLILYMRESMHVGQELVQAKINAEFPDLVKTFIVNCQNPAHSLANSFSRMARGLTPEFCRHGAMVIIGKRAIDTGVTVKPELGTRLEAEYDGRKYAISHVTDQFVNISGDLQNDKQSMRLCGWNMPGATPRLYVKGGEATYFTTHLPELDIHIIRKYNGEVGPRSLLHIFSANELIRSISPNTPHHKKVYTVRGYVSDYPLYRAVELPTSISRAEDYLRLRNTLADVRDMLDKPFKQFAGTGRSQEARRLHKALFQRGHCGQIAWSDERYEQILQAVGNPGETDNWQVNAFFYAPRDDTLIRDCIVVVFNSEWDSRQTVSDETPCVQALISNEPARYLRVEKCSQFTLQDEALAIYDAPELSAEHKHQLEVEIPRQVDAAREGAKRSACSLCGAPGTNKSTCPRNPAARRHDHAKHNLA